MARTGDTVTGSRHRQGGQAPHYRETRGSTIGSLDSMVEAQETLCHRDCSDFGIETVGPWSKTQIETIDTLE